MQFLPNKIKKTHGMYFEAKGKYSLLARCNATVNLWLSRSSISPSKAGRSIDRGKAIPQKSTSDMGLAVYRVHRKKPELTADI